MARNPSGDGHLRPSALSFVGGDHPDRHPPHFAPSGRRSPPRLPRDFYHGLPAYSADDEVRSQAGQNVITVLNARFAELNAKIEAFETRIDAKIEALETRIDAKIENAQGQIDSLRAELSGRLDAVNSRIDTLQRVIWPLVVLLASTVFGLLYRVLTVPQPGP